jgi:DNA repair protein RadD
MINLRPYQRDAINATLDYWAAGGGNPLVVMATGTGKSVVIATAVRELLESFPDMRVIMLTHVKELVAQNAKAMLNVWPQAPIGINSAGLGRRDKRSQILFASIQSVHKESAATLGRRDLILVDEAHLIPRSGSGMYLSFIERMREDVPDLRVAGYTATPFRLGSGRLDMGDDRIFDKIVYDYGIAEGIRDGYLSPLVSKATATALDLSGVKRAGGEFVASSLEAAIDQDWITRAAVGEMIAFGENRRSWLVFAAGVDHAFHLRDMIRQSGVSCETVTGETPNGERDRIIREFKAGRIRCLTNVGVLTTGFDAPSVDLIAMLRPTLSTGLYIQMVGRTTRLAVGKDNALILDFAGNVRRHGPVDAIAVSGGPKKKKEGAATVDEINAKECPDCQTLVRLNTRECPMCGHSWKTETGPKHDAHADGDSYILSSQAPDWRGVSDVALFQHVKPGGRPSLRVEYRVGITVYCKWVCLEHDRGSLPRRKAEEWWRKMGGGTPPDSIAEALQRQSDLRLPDEIRIKPAGKYFEIIGERHAKALEHA